MLQPAAQPHQLWAAAGPADGVAHWSGPPGLPVETGQRHQGEQPVQGEVGALQQGLLTDKAGLAGQSAGVTGEVTLPVPHLSRLTFYSWGNFE